MSWLNINGNWIGRNSGVSWSSYCSSLNPGFWVKENSRDGLTLTDSVNTENSPIIMPASINHALNMTPVGAILTGIVPDANTIIIIRGSYTYLSDEGNGSGFRWYVSDYGGYRWYFRWGNADGGSHVNKYGTSNVIFDNDWHTFIFYDKRMWLLAPNVDISTDAKILNIIATSNPLINITSATWSGETQAIRLLSNYNFTHAQNGQRALTFIGNLVGGVITWQKKYVFNQTTPYDILGAGEKITIVNNSGGTTVGSLPTKIYSAYGWDTLTHGHTLAYLAGTGIISVPKAINGFISELPTGYVKLQDQAGNLLNHNLADSLIRFAAGSIWDRSSATVWKDECRAASDYDAGNPTDWNVFNLNALQLYEWLEDDYKYILGVKFNPNSVDIEERLTMLELFSFSSNLTESQMHKIWRFTNDYNLIVI